MPAKNSSKTYIENSYYHIYNRGIEKKNIFLDKQDYGVFLSFIKSYVLPIDEQELRLNLVNPNVSSIERDRILKTLQRNNFSGEITLNAYCLMPNHFHLLIHQQTETAIDKFMNSLATRYTMYFNRKYLRVGPLYQSVYKAVLVTTDEQLLHLTRYIHKNPTYLAFQGVALEAIPQPSSYPEYLGLRKTEWVHPEEILKYFSKTNPHNSYKSFVAEEEIGELIKDIAIDI
jgi:putative transposase